MASSKDWYDGMNAEQRAVVAHGEGPAAVLAGAGAGKTTTLTGRVATLVERGVRPDRIAFVTFSNRAAAQIKERLARFGVAGVEAGTWHSLALRILREDRTRCATWRVDERDEHRFLVKEAMGFRHVNWPGDLGELLRFIAICKANLAGPQGERTRALAEQRFGADAARALAVYAASEKLVAERKLLTFDDMLYLVWRHLSDEDNRRRWAGRWDHLLQDEVQDASRAMVDIADQLARDHRNYMIVGDPAQSIYGFRGSSPAYLTEFAEVWKARVYCMNRNYRSGRAVVSLANTIIRPAEVRLPVDLVAERPLDGVVRVRAAATLDDEAEEVANDIAAFVAGGGRYGAAAVLARTNAQSRAVEDVFVRRGIPYVVLGGCAFYERREVRDLLAYLRLASERDLRTETLRQCLNAPFRFLPAALAERLREASGKTWAERAMEAGAGAGLKPRQAEAVAEWGGVMDGLARAIGQGTRPAELLNDLMGRLRYIEHLEREQGRESIEASPGANVRELVRVAERFDTVDRLLDFVNETLRAVEQARKDADAQDRVLVMSVHRSKGLEWPRVWVIGCNEEILPHQRGDLEEERRLLYVAATRARDELTLSHVAAISTRAGTRPGEPSRFLVEAGLVPGADTQEGV